MNRPRLRAFGLPFLALLLLTILLTWPTAITLGSRVVDRQDPLLNAWIMAREARQLLVDPLHLYDSNIFFPLRNTLAFSEVLLSTSALVMPIQWFTGDALFSYNVAFLLSFFTTALGVYLLALYLTGHRGAALVAAVAFTWSPYRMGHLSQLQLLAFGWLPLALLYLDRLLRERGSWRKNAALFALFFLLQALASFYAALFSAIACALYVVGWLAWKRRLPRTALAGGLLAALSVALVMVPLSLPYFEVQRSLGAGWTLQQNEQFSASLQAYAYAPEETPIWGPLTRPLRYVYGPCCPPDTLFPGLTLLVLSGVGLWRGGGRRSLWLVLALVAFVLSLGPTLTIRALQPTGIPLPYGWLWEHIPGFNAIRAPVRWAVLVMLALSLLAALGLARFRWRWAAPLALALVLIEFNVAPLALVTPPQPPDSLAWLKEQPPTRILELPLVVERPSPPVPEDEPRRAWETSRLLEAQFFSSEHWHTTPDGYSGYVPMRHGDFAREMQGFPSPRSIALLQGLEVRYVVIHEDDLTPERAALLRVALPEGAREVARFGDERILELAPYDYPDLPDEALPVTILPPEQRVDMPLVLTSPGGPYVPVSGEPLAISVRWQQGRETREETVRVPWPMIVEEVAVLSLPLDTPPAGEWTLTLKGTYPEGRGFILEQPVNIAEGQPAPPRLLPVALEEVVRIDSRTLALSWRAYQPLERYYSLSARLHAPDGSLVVQQDGPPAEVPTVAWQPSNPYTAEWRFDLPEGTSVEDFRLMVLWYDPEGGSPVRLWDGQQFVEQFNVEVPGSQ
jgi:hypothetical protein